MTQHICIGYTDGSWYTLQPGVELPTGLSKIAVIELVNYEPSNPDLTAEEASREPEFASLVIDTLEATGKWKLASWAKRP